ncbi:MAG: virulence RhuM family protein [Clostridia bacterium]|nr:virulence RhuM family protein [Clostridia bacterium]
MTMQDWSKKLDDFLRMINSEILESTGQISHQTAIEKANLEYDKNK